MESQAQLTVDIISKVAECKITNANAAKLLNKSRRTIERYLHQNHMVGIQFVVQRFLNDAWFCNQVFSIRGLISI